MEGKRARLIKVKVGNPSDLKVLSVPYALPPGTISYFNFEGSFLYAVLAPNLNSGMQSFDLRRFPLDEIILGKRKTTLVNDSAPVEEKRRAILNEIFKDLTLPEGVVVGLEPLSNVFRWSKLPIIMPLDLPWKPGPIWYDVLINQGNSYTLYILNNNNLAIWNTVLKGDGGHDRPEWKEIASLKTEFNEPFAVFAQGNNASIVTASGEVFVISGEKLTKVSAFTPQVSGEG
ncbi:MAG: hypothetical protein ACRD63_09030, partial [Pyrinomonadaceae bacterium]